MKITAERDQQSQYVVRIEVDPAELNEAKGKAAKRLSNQVRIPGFRPGKAPRALVERVVGQEALLEEATKILVPQAYKEALQDQDIKPIADPELNIESTDPLTIIATIPVEPTVELGDYKSIKHDLVIPEVTEEEVDKTIQQLRDQNSTWEEPETPRPAQDGDQVEIELQSIRDGEPSGEPFTRTGVLGKGELLEQIDDQVAGMEVNQEKTLEIARAKPAKSAEETEESEAEGEGESEAQELPEVETIPLEEEETAPLTFRAKLNSIKVKNEPPLDDSFAASVSELQTLDELKDRIRNNLKAQKEEEAKRELVDTIVKEAVEQSKVQLPPVMIHGEIHAMEENMANRLKQQKLSLDQYLAIMGKTHEQFHEELEPQAVNRILTALVLRDIAKAEGIAVSGEDLDREVEKMVDEYTSNTPEDQKEEQGKRIREIFNQQQMRDQFTDNIFSRKLAERLIELSTGKALNTEEVDLELKEPSEEVAAEVQEERMEAEEIAAPKKSRKSKTAEPAE